jgi:hypothetical protein
VSLSQFSIDEGLAQATPVVAQRWLQYRPQVVLLSETGFHNLGLSPRAISRVGDVALRGGGFEFPGNNGYISLGAGNLVAVDAHTMVAVFQADSFSTQYLILASYNVVGGSNRVSCFVSSDPSYSDFSFGATGGGGTV